MKPVRYALRTLMILTVALVMVTTPVVDNGVLAETVDKFSNGSTEVTLSLEAASQNTEGSLLVPAFGTVTEATFDVTGMPYGDFNYPNRVQVHVGVLGSRVYQWADRFYSPMGFQDRFTDWSTSTDITFEDQGYNNSYSIKLPAGADITTATMRVTGIEYDAGWDYPVKLSHKVGNNQVPIAVGGRPAPQLIDYDDDGDLDMLSGGYQYSGGRVQWIFLFENIGTKAAPKWQRDTSYIPINYNYAFVYSAPRLHDLDGDGDRDLVIGQYNGQISVFWNTGTNANPHWTGDSDSQAAVFYGIDEGSYATVDFADMDNDDDLDLAYGRYAATGSSNVGVSSYENRYANGNWSWATASFFNSVETDEASAPCILDYDGDGDYDMFVGNYNGTVAYYENTGTKSSPKWKYIPDGGGNIDVGAWARPSLGDLDNDGDLDLVVGSMDGSFYFYEKILSAPTDPAIDVGGDGDNDWTFSGELEGVKTTGNMAAEFESHLKGSYSHSDNWGNNFYDININFTSLSPGILRIDQISIVFEYTASTIDFTAILNEYIEDNQDKVNDEGFLKVPIIVTSATKGKLKLSNLNIVVDMPPEWLHIPSTYAIDEDTKNMQLIDLRDYVSDDYTGKGSLKFKLIRLDKNEFIGVTIENGRYIGVDAETGTDNDNWHGTVSLYVRAADARGQAAFSNNFTIDVRPVNDIPELTGLPPSEIYEDEAFSFRIGAMDVDGDPLEFDLIGAPSDMTISEDGVVAWTPTNDDVGTHQIRITVTDPSGASAAYDWVLTVINVNDPPTLDLPKSLTVTEGQPFLLDLSDSYSDVDNPKDQLELKVDNPFAEFDEGSKTVTLFYPKETGIEQDKLLIVVIDPEGAETTGVIILNIIRVEKLALFGIPDQLAVEEDSWTVDIKPYLYNVEDWNKLVITTSSPYIQVDGTRLNLHYPEDSLADLMESVKVTAQQGEEVANDVFIVTLKKLGEDLSLGIIPDQDVLEEEEYLLDITPYIKKAPDIDQVTVTISASEHVMVEGRVLVFKYPMYYGPDSEEVTVTISYGEFGDSATFTVRILNAEDDFVLTDIPDVYVTETVPETFNIKQYIKNAHDIDYITATTDSPYADVNRFDIQLTYPEGFTGDAKTMDDLIHVTITDGLRDFRKPVTVHVERLGKDLQLSGIGDKTVYYDTDLVIDLMPYLYNVDDITDVTVDVDPDVYVTRSGFVFTFNFPSSLSISSHQVTFRANEDEDRAEETITIYLEHVPMVFAFGPIGSITAMEDEPYVLDVEPYLKNMASGVDYTLGVHSDYAAVEGFVITFYYDVEEAMDEIVRINVTGDNDDFAEQDVYVHVKPVNDLPQLIKVMEPNYVVIEGEPALVIDLTEHFTDVDSDALEFDCNENLVVIDNEAGTATVVFAMDDPRPGDLKDVILYAFDPDDPTSMGESNKFNITFYLAGEDPGTGGPDGPGVQGPSGSSGWFLIAILVLVGAAGVAWMWYRKRKPAVEM
jgi:hypothetical protein